jgi:hypothetical protein
VKRRIIVKRDRDKWGVYDTDQASWPGAVLGYGPVRQKHDTEAEAEAEAEALDKFYRGVA